MPRTIYEVEKKQSRLIRHHQAKYSVSHLILQDECSNDELTAVLYCAEYFAFLKAQFECYKLKKPRSPMVLVFSDKSEAPQVTFLHDNFSAVELLFRCSAISERTFALAQDHLHTVISNFIKNTKP